MMMSELGFQSNKSSSVSGFRVRDGSPDSVIFILESNFSLLSSASASVERCSFASDAHDYDSEVSPQLAGRSSGPDPNQNKGSTVGNKHSRLSRKGEKAKAHKEDSDADLEEEELQPLDSARSSFSIALKECLDRSPRSEALQRKRDGQRPASLDLNNASVSSPRLGSMKKNSASSRLSGAFPSPGTPNYRHSSVGMKGWSSERVPLHGSGGSRNHLCPASSLPFNNGKALPSKWEDAERWICSPVGGDGISRVSITQPQRRPKSKSGPLGPPGVAYNSLYSPGMPMYDGGNSGNFIAGSPVSAGVVSTERLAIHSSGRVGTGSVRTDPCMARSVSVHGCSDMLLHTGSQDENLSGVKDAATDISRTVSRRDMATQMSPDGSPHSSPKIRHSISTWHPPVLPTLELQSVSFSESEVRDVQVDEQVTMTRWSKKHKTRIPGKGYVDVWRKKERDGSARYSSAWDITDAAKSISKVKREEAKIAAWENLQKAKAEAAIRKLEMKLEKQRSSSMDRIMNKLRFAQKKAQEMRSSVSENRDQQVTRTSMNKAVSFHRTHQIPSLSGCFTCHAF